MRGATLRAAYYLIRARIRVRLSSLEQLRGSVQKIRQDHSDRSGEAQFWAGRIARAASRLPDESKCLPQALALHWLLAERGISSRIAIAIHQTEREADHAYHAWLDHDGEMLVGACDRSQYHVILTLGGPTGGAAA